MSVRTLNEFIEWAAQFNDGKYLFRGVPNDTFDIQASAYRRLPEADTDNPSKLLKINQRLIEDARSQGHDQKNGQQLSDLELLAELQHFGAATCLIDFSRSALAALWFACLKNPKKEEEEANGTVFTVRHDDVVHLRTVTPKLIKEDIDYFFQPDENGSYPLYQWAPKLQNNRIIAQHSVFVFGAAQIEVAAECVIIKSSKQEILKSLEEISDITEATMYPDFDGFARLHAHDKPYIEPDARTYLQRGIEAAQRGDLDAAIKYYDEAIDLKPDFTGAYNNRGVAYNDKSNYGRALRDFNKAIELKPDLWEAYTNRGNAYYKKGEHDHAIVDYNKAIELKPDIAESYYNRGTTYYNKGEHDRAIEDYNKAIELRPNLAEVYNNRGIAYDNKGDYDRAIEDYNKAIELKPDLADAYINRGNAYSQRCVVNRAIVDYNKAIELNSDLAEPYTGRGEVWLQLEEWEKARADLTTAKDMGADIITSFHNGYENVPDFETKHGIQLPEDITTMLTPQ